MHARDHKKYAYTIPKERSSNIILTRKAIQRTVLTSQSEILLSTEHVTNVLEKGRNSTLLTESLCPRRVKIQAPLKHTINIHIVRVQYVPDGIP